jgi:small conductance mechanosensitive channel
MKTLETGWLKTLLTPEVVGKSLDILVSGLIVLLAVVLSRLLKRWLNAAMERSRIRDDLLLRSFFLRVLSITIISVGALIALRVMGLDVTSFIAGLGVTGIILGFGFKDVLSNLAAGLLLLIYRPFRAGHMIEVEGAQGTVEELTIVNMQMTTTDGVRVIMPNSKVWGAKIVNYSLSQQRRLELSLKVGEEDVNRAIGEIRAALERDSRVLKTPPPSVRVTGIADNSATLTIWAWTQPADYVAAGADQYIRLQSALWDAEIPIK